MTTKNLIIISFAALSLALPVRADITTGLEGWWTFDDGSGSSTAADSSGNGYTGTLTDFSDTTFTSMWVNGWIGGALLFNVNGDTSDYVSVPDASGLDFGSTKAFTVAAWVNLSVAGGSQSNGACILCKGVTGQEQYSLDVTGGQFRMLTRNSSGKSQQTVTSTITAASNTWYHVAGIWSASPQQQYIYIDGVYNNTYSGSGFLTSGNNSSQPLTIGCAQSSTSSGYNLPFQGIIDDVRIYNRVLAPSDIYQLYTNGATSANAPVITTQPRGIAAYLGDSATFAVALNTSTTLLPISYQWQFDSTNIAGATTSALVLSNLQATNAGTYSVTVTNVEGAAISSNAVLTLKSLPAVNTANGLVGYWKFDDGSGASTAADSSGNDDTGTLTYFADTTYTSMWTNGVIGDALAFNGDGTGSNVVAVPSVGAPAPAVLDFSSRPALTVAAWVQGSLTQSNEAAIIAEGTGNGGEQYVLELNGGGHVYRFFVRDTNGVVYNITSAVAASGTWQHVAGVLNASNGIMNLYVNGALAAETVAPFSLQTNNQPMNIGNRQPGTGSYGDPFTGDLDEVRVYNRDLTSADVAALYAAKPAALGVTWPATNLDVVAGVNAQIAPAIVGGIPPYTYQWQQNGSNLPGATKDPLILTNVGAAAAGTYDVIVSNSNIVAAVTSSPVALNIESWLTFNTNGVNWMAQGSSPSAVWLGTNTVKLTPFANSQSNSIFYDFPLQVGQFQASFTYQVTQVPTGSTGPGDGLAFCLQTDPRGPAAIGDNGADLGFATNGLGGEPITPSVEVALDIADTSAVAFDTNGVIEPVIPAYPVSLTSMDPMSVVITYQSDLLTVTLTDTNTSATFAASTPLDVTNVLGSALAYVGFTASTGAGYAGQQISDFQFQSLVNLTIQASNNTALISWPTGVGGYVLQQNSNLTTPNWVNVTNTVNLVNGANQVTVPITSQPNYYQLLLP